MPDLPSATHDRATERAGLTPRSSTGRKRSDTATARQYDSKATAPYRHPSLQQQQATGVSGTDSPSTRRANTIDPKLQPGDNSSYSRTKTPSKESRTAHNVPHNPSASTGIHPGGPSSPYTDNQGVPSQTTGAYNGSISSSPSLTSYLLHQQRTTLVSSRPSPSAFHKPSYESLSDYNPARPLTSPHDQQSILPYALPPPSSLPSSSAKLRVHSTRTATSAPGSRKSSITSSDREVSGLLDFKRLMSKPAKPMTSASSIVSIPSDPEPFGASHPRRTMSAQVSSRQRKISAPTAPSLQQQKLTKDRPVVQVATVNSRPPPPMVMGRPRSSTQRSSPQPSPREGISPSSPRWKSSTPSSPVFVTSPSSLTVHSRSADAQSSRSSSKASPSSIRPETSPRMASNSRRATADPVVLRGRLNAAVQPSGLTPAGAVVHAYKQQSQRRKELEQLSGWNDQQGQGSSSNFTSSPSSEDEAGGAYYSVYGGTTEHASPPPAGWEASWGSPSQVRISTGKIHHQSSPSTQSGIGMKTLTRKVSGKFRKVAGAVKGRDASPFGGRSGESTVHTFDAGWLPYDGRARDQERTPRKSIDERDRSLLSDKSTTPLRGPSTGNSSEELTQTIHMNEREKQKEDDQSPSHGGKLLKLIKRLSAGGLRDKYASRESAPPPVPALPKTYQNSPASRTTIDIHKSPDRENFGSESGMLSRFMQSRASLSGVRPSTSSASTTPRASEFGIRPSTSTGPGQGQRTYPSASAPRPSMGTQSSESPISSELPSPRFFPGGGHSSHSSMTSYGDDFSGHNSPTALIGQHIIPPSELNRLNKDAEEKSQQQQRHSFVRPRVQTHRANTAPDDPLRVSAGIDQPSLPFPPRRAMTATGSSSTTKKERTPGSPPSPDIPAFSTEDTVNNFCLPPSVTMSMSEFGVVASDSMAPPRPKRSSRRHPGALDLSEATSTSTIRPTGPTTPHKFSALPTLNVVDHSTYPSTPRRGSSPTSSRTSRTSNNHSPLTYRELGSPRPVLSEKEKADKWDDLLERSDRAGGTLHLGESGLMSDNMRFSVYSDT